MFVLTGGVWHKQDNLLIKGVDLFGRNWKTIVELHFPRRTALAAKNRYSLLCRRMSGGNQRPTRGVAKQKRARISVTTASPSSNQGGSLSVCSNTSGVPDHFDSDGEVDGNDEEMSSVDDEDEGYSEDDSSMGTNPQLGGFTSPAEAPNLDDLSNASGRPRCPYPQHPVRSGYDVLGARPTMAQTNRPREEQRSQEHEMQNGQAMVYDYNCSDFSSDVFADFDALQQTFMQAATSATPLRQHLFVDNNTGASNTFNLNNSSTRDAPILHAQGTASLDAEMGYGSVVSPHRDSDGVYDQRPYVVRKNANYQLPSPDVSQQASPDPLGKGPDRVLESDSTKQVTIVALCSGVQLGKLVQTVTDIASSVTVSIVEPSSS